MSNDNGQTPSKQAEQDEISREIARGRALSPEKVNYRIQKIVDGMEEIPLVSAAGVFQGVQAYIQYRQAALQHEQNRQQQEAHEKAVEAQAAVERERQFGLRNPN